MMRVAATQRLVAEAEAGSGTRHGFRAIVRRAITGKPREPSAPQLEGGAAEQADHDALEAYVNELHLWQPTGRNQWDAREGRSHGRQRQAATTDVRRRRAATSRRRQASAL